MRAIATAAAVAALTFNLAASGAEPSSKPEWKEANPKAPAAVASPLVVGAAFTGQGPQPLRNGQDEGMTDDPVVGAFEALAAHPTDSNTLWAGSVNGGIWKTTNLGSTLPDWTNQTPSGTALSISALEVDPTDATVSTLYAGFANRSSWGVSGALNGILKTTDGGTTWTSPGSTLSGKSIGGIAPRGAIVVVASVSDGIWRSTNGGAAFTQISGTAALPAGHTFDLAGDPLNTAHLFTVVTSSAPTSNNGIYRSTDTGATWTKVTTPFDTTFNSATAISRVELALGRRGTVANGGVAGANVFFAACTAGRLAGLFGSTNAGAAWATHDQPSTPDNGPEGLHPGGQCSTHLSIVADPAVHTAVYVGGDRQPYATESSGGSTFFPNSLGANNYSGRIFRSDFALAAGSQTYPVTHCSAVHPGCGGAIRTAGNSAPHADSREMVFLPSGDLVESDDGGVFRLHLPNTAGSDWSSLIGSSTTALNAQEQHNTNYDPISNILFSGNQDTGSGMQSATGSPLWNTLNQGDGGDVGLGRNDPIAGQSTRYHSSQSLGGFTRRVYNSSNGLVTSTFPALTVLGGGAAMTKQFVTPVIVNSIDPTRILFGAANGIYESADRGSSVTRITTSSVNSPLSGGGPTMVYGVTGNADALYVASGSNILVRTVAPPTAPTSTTPAGGTVRALAVKPGNVNRAIAVTSGAVFTSTNGGGVWTSVTANLASFNPGNLRSAAYVEGSSDDVVVVGADRGVYRARVSALGGATSWDQLGTGLPNAPVFDLRYDAGDDLLTAGTLGRGAWTLTGLQVVSSCSNPTAAVTGAATICAGASTTIQAALTGTSPWTVTWSDATVQSGITVSPATRVVSPTSTTTFTVTALNDAGCAAQAGDLSGGAAVTVNPDVAAPTVTAPAPITINQTICCGTFGGATGAGSATLATFLAAGTATDDCDPSPTHLTAQVGGVDVTGATCFAAGTTSVTFRFRDASSKVGTATAGVTVRMFGDLNVDNTVDPSDMVVLRAYFNFVVTPGTPPFTAPLGMADLNHDTVVDPSDAVILRAYFNFVVSCLAP